MSKEELLAEIELLGGYEVPKPLWPIAEELEKAGKIDLGPARGPGGAWKRAVPSGEEID